CSPRSLRVFPPLVLDLLPLTVVVRVSYHFTSPGEWREMHILIEKNPAYKATIFSMKASNRKCSLVGLVIPVPSLKLTKNPYVKNKVVKTIIFSQLIYVFRWHIQGRFVYNVKYG